MKDDDSPIPSHWECASRVRVECFLSRLFRRRTQTGSKRVMISTTPVAQHHASPRFAEQLGRIHADRYAKPRVRHYFQHVGATGLQHPAESKRKSGCFAYRHSKKRSIHGGFTRGGRGRFRRGGAGRAGTPGDGAGGATGPATFADAVAAVMRLPLTDAEKAQAVRRLLGDHDAGRKA